MTELDFWIASSLILEPMAWLVIALVVLPVAGIVLLLPYTALRIALRNTRRADGSRSQRRARRERRHAVEFAGHVLLVPLLVVAVAGSALVGVHRFVAPVPLLLDVAGAFDTDAAAWERAIEQERLGDVGAAYESWSRRRGFSYRTARYWQELLWAYWPTLVAILTLGGLLFYGLLARVYAGASAAYQRGVYRRQHQYRKRDARAAISQQNEATR